MQPRSATRCLGLVGAVVLCAVAACSNDSAALYAREGDAGAAPVALPLLPKTPDARVLKACRVCAASECKDARTSCLKDDACTALLRCKGECSDPACLEHCEIGNDRSAWYDDYSACVFETTCSAACAQGQSFGCLGRYDVRSSQAGSYDVTWHFTSRTDPEDPARSSYSLGPTLQGAKVRACAPTSTDCSAAGSAQGIATVGAYSRATMTLQGAPFRGYLEVTGGAYDEQSLVYGWAISGPGWREVGFVGRAYFLGDPGGLDFKAPNHANLLLAANDCLDEPAPGLHFLLSGQPIEEIAYAHVDSTFDANGPTSGAGVAFATLNLERENQRQVVLEARNENEDTLASRSVLLRAGWSTTIGLYPREQSGQ